MLKPKTKLKLITSKEIHNASKKA